jgi:hypothetical protein
VNDIEDKLVTPFYLKVLHGNLVTQVPGREQEVILGQMSAVAGAVTLGASAERRLGVGEVLSKTALLLPCCTPGRGRWCPARPTWGCRAGGERRDRRRAGRSPIDLAGLTGTLIVQD